MKLPGGIEQYVGVSIDWIRGHDPTLLVYDDAGVQVEKIALAPYSTEALHKLFSSKFKSIKGGAARRQLRAVNASAPSAASQHEAAGILPSNDGLPAADPAGPPGGGAMRPLLFMSIGALSVVLYVALSRARKPLSLGKGMLGSAYADAV